VPAVQPIENKHQRSPTVLWGRPKGKLSLIKSIGNPDRIGGGINPVPATNGQSRWDWGGDLLQWGYRKAILNGIGSEKIN
jgi:hypothetical protein